MEKSAKDSDYNVFFVKHEFSVENDLTEAVFMDENKEKKNRYKQEGDRKNIESQETKSKTPKSKTPKSKTTKSKTSKSKTTKSIVDDSKSKQK